MSVALPQTPRRLHAGAPASRTEALLQTAALYGAFVLIAAVVFGTLSFHPF
jgi:hypothetical protein